MTTVVLVSSVFSAATVAAAIDDGLLPGSRVLVAVNNAAVAEVVPGLPDHPRFETFAARFDAVINLNEVIAPLHPRDLSTSDAWRDSIYDEILAVVEGPVTRVVAPSVPNPPSSMIAQLFPQAAVDAVVTTLSDYGPMSPDAPATVISRVKRHIHVDLIPGVIPQRFPGTQVVPTAVSTPSFLNAIAQFAGTTESAQVAEAWLLRDHFVDHSLFSPDAEEELYSRIVNTVADAGYSAVALKPHPDAPFVNTIALAALAAERSLSFRTLDGSVSAEEGFATAPPSAVFGYASTALATARVLYGIPAFTVGALEVAETLADGEGDQPPTPVEPQTILDVRQSLLSAPRRRRPSLVRLLANSLLGRHYRRARNVLAAMRFAWHL